MNIQLPSVKDKSKLNAYIKECKHFNERHISKDQTRISKRRLKIKFLKMIARWDKEQKI